MNEDLPQIAEWFASDCVDKIEDLITLQRLAPVADEKAKQWIAERAVVWAVVVAPWVLVQEPAPMSAHE